MKGVKECIVGYCGGMQPNPTYRNMKDSTESVLIEYDPNKISFLDILNYWKKSARGYRGIKRQYRSAVFYTNPEQHSLAKKVVDEMKRDNGGSDVYVAIEPINPFYRAEEYHQHYMEKRYKGKGIGVGMCTI